MGAANNDITHHEADVEASEVERIATVDPVPDPIRVEGGLIVGTEGLKETTGLKLAEDGAVSELPSM